MGNCDSSSPDCYQLDIGECVKFWTDEQKKLIEQIRQKHQPKIDELTKMAIYTQPSGSEDVWKLLRVITLQNKALEKAIEAMDAMIAPDLPKWTLEQERIGNTAIIAHCKVEITNIMEGRG